MRGRNDRPARVAERIREEVSIILQNRVKDPGMRVVTVTDVTITPDLKSARVHYSVLGDDADRIAVRDALRRSKGFIRSELGRSLQMRYSPEIFFIYDNTFEKGAKMDRLLESINTGSRDEE